DADRLVDQNDPVLGALVRRAGWAHGDASRFFAVQTGFWEIDRPRRGSVTLLEGMDTVEPHAPGALAIGIEIGKRGHVAAGIPLLAGSGAGVAADADIEVDDEP